MLEIAREGTFSRAFTHTPPNLPHNPLTALTGTRVMNRMTGEGGGAGSVALRWRGWVMNPQVRALKETKGNGPVLRQGKNAGDADEPRRTQNLRKARSPASLPGPLEKIGARARFRSPSVSPLDRRRTRAMQTARIFDTLLFETALQAAATSAGLPASCRRRICRDSGRCALRYQPWNGEIDRGCSPTFAIARAAAWHVEFLDLLGRIDPEGSVYDAVARPHLEALPHPGPKPQAKPGPSAEACAKVIAAAFGIPLPAA